jgi:hypothetical protein
MNTLTRLALCVTVALVSACGGGSPAPAPVAASDAVPDAASQSAQGMADWMTQLAGDTTAEAKAPLDVSRFVPPTAEDAEPVALK